MIAEKLRSLLGSAVATPSDLSPNGAPTPAIEPDYAEIERLARDRYRKAIRAHELAGKELDRVVAHRQRVEQVIRDAATAERELKAAEECAAAAAREWAQRGATGSEDSDALSRATRAREDAYRLRFLAAGSAAALPTVKDDEQLARNLIETAQGEVDSARAGILLAIAGPQVEAMQRARATYLEARHSIAGLRFLTWSRWGSSAEFYPHRAPEVSEMLAKRLEELSVAPLTGPDPNDLEAWQSLWSSAREWGEVARRIESEAEVQ